MSLPTFALSLLVALASPLPLGPPPHESPWRPPVTPFVVARPFVAPSSPYAPGHRGVDLAAEPGTVVRAPANGVVRVAGRIAGKSVVSVEHPHRILGRIGWRSTYEGVAARVDIGASVRAGDPLGVVIPHPHGPGVHWGLKNGRVYADPLMMLRGPVVLKPLGSYARGCACS